MPHADDQIDIIIVSPTDTDVTLSLWTLGGTGPAVLEERLQPADRTFVFNRRLQVQLPVGLLEVDAQLAFDTPRIQHVMSRSSPSAAAHALGFLPRAPSWTVWSSSHAAKASSLDVGINGRLAGAPLTVRLLPKSVLNGNSYYGFELTDSTDRSFAGGKLVLPDSWAPVPWVPG